jgi:hypothetical protein
MKIGTELYSYHTNYDLFVERTGAKSWVIRLRHARTSDLLDKRILIDYTKAQAMTIAKDMLKTYQEKTA